MKLRFKWPSKANGRSRRTKLRTRAMYLLDDTYESYPDIELLAFVGTFMALKITNTASLG